jgi:hypothetical protein
MRNNLISDQKSVWFFDPQAERQFDGGDLYARLDSVYTDVLPRDISMHVMPIGGTSKARKEFAISILPKDEKLEGIIACAVAEQPDSYFGRGITAAVCEFVERVTSRLMYYGKAAVFEIVFLRDPKTNNLAGCDLFSRREIIQRVPAKVAAERNLPTSIELDLDRLAIFSLPTEFQAIGKLKESLSKLGGGTLTRMFDTSRQSDRFGYDIKEHIRFQQLATAAATRSIGWSANQNLYELFTEYYILYRRLRFERFIIILRESILETLSVAIDRIAKQFGTTAELKVVGLPTLSDVERARRELAAGQRKFGSVLDDFTLL